MSSFYDYRALSPVTRASIQEQGGEPDNKPCGCHQRGEYEWKWWLCSYHDGFEDGVDVALSPPEDQVDRVIAATVTHGRLTRDQVLAVLAALRVGTDV